MKKGFLLMVAALCCLTSCIEEENQILPQTPETLVEKVFTVSEDGLSKVYLGEDGESLLWSASDCVSVWDGTANRKFTVKNFEGGAATLVGQVAEGATDFFAVYPYTDKLEISAPDNAERDIRIRFPFVSDQKAVPNSVANGVCVAVARTQGSTLDFMNKTAMLKFSLDPSFTDVKAVTIESASNYISGTYNIEWQGNSTAHMGIAYSGRGKTITFSNEDGSALSTGVDYHIVLPPNTNAGGFSVSMTLVDGTVLTKSSTKVQSFTSGQIMQLSKTPLTKAMFMPVETYGRHALWQNNVAFEICGTPYGSSSHGAATLITAESGAQTITSGGVYFIEDGADVTLGTGKTGDIILIGNNPQVRSRVKFSGFYLTANANVTCLGIDFTPASETWPSGKDLINETTAAGDLRFEDCRLYHPSNARYFVYATTSGEGLASSFKSLHVKGCTYTILSPDSKAYLLNCPLEGASIIFEKTIFHCNSYQDFADEFKLIGLTNKSQTVSEVKLIGNDFINCSASTAGVIGYISAGPSYEYMEITGNIFYMPKAIADEKLINVTAENGLVENNWYFTGTTASEFNTLTLFVNTPSWASGKVVLSDTGEIPYVEPMTFATSTFVRKDAYNRVPEDAGYDVYLLIGQSNAAGRGALTDADKTTYLEGVMQWNPATETMQPAIQPLNLLSTVRKKASVQGFNLAGPFASKIHSETGRPVLIVVNARGETLISAWMKEGNGGKVTTYDADRDDPEKVGQSVWLYAEAVRVTKQAMKYGTLKGILWHQGCGNSSEGNSASYLSALKKVVNDLRTDLGTPNVPFVAGQLLPEFRNAQYFNPMILTIGTTIPNAFCATSEDCVSIGDGTHFDRDSHVKMGERYADIILKEVYGKTK